MIHNENTTAPLNAPDKLHAKSGVLTAGFWVLFVIALLLAISAYFAVPAFEDLFQGFGTNIPALTQLVMKMAKLLLILPAMFAIPAIMYTEVAQLTPASQRQYLTLFWFGFLLLLGVIGLVVYAMYLPLLEMGAEVVG